MAITGTPTDSTTPGVAASAGVGRGPARRVRSAGDLARARPGDVLLFDQLPASWVPLLPAPAGVAVARGGVLCNAATQLRERGVPAVFGVATRSIGEGRSVEVDGGAGRLTVLD
jgi:phosphoenolpyruvate synthase/pyruvate phosphate dikinase